MSNAKRKFVYRHADGRTEAVSCEWDDDAELWKGYTDDNQRALFEPDGTQFYEQRSGRTNGLGCVWMVRFGQAIPHKQGRLHAARKASTLRETTLAEAEAYGFEECRTCNGDHEVGEYDTSYQRALKDAAKSD